jgi:hypothetical protein
MRNTSAILELSAADIGAFGGDGLKCEVHVPHSIEHGPAQFKALRFGFSAASEHENEPAVRPCACLLLAAFDLH